MARPIETRWEERREMTTAEHLKALDYDQDELERRMASVNGKLDRIFVAVATAAVALVGNLIIRLLESQIPVPGTPEGYVTLIGRIFNG